MFDHGHHMVDLDSSELSMVDYGMHHGQFMVKHGQFGISKLLINLKYEKLQHLLFLIRRILFLINFTFPNLIDLC